MLLNMHSGAWGTSPRRFWRAVGSDLSPALLSILRSTELCSGRITQVPAIWVDRAGAKVTLTEQHTRQSKITGGLVVEEVTTRDEQGMPCANGMRGGNTGFPQADGPPTTFSATGTDRVAFVQMNVTRDNTYFCNGTPVGARDILTVDQGLGVLPGNPMYNRSVVSMTRFLMLKKPARQSEMPPPVLVLHGRAGNVIGDLTAYDAFALGGPYSSRGYSVGELGACRRFLEGAAEMRIPVRSGGSSTAFASRTS
jgi:outer membrane protein assembly factor BamA